METSALNQAHLQYRRAETHLKYKRFPEAVECHKKAAELLDEALNFTQNFKSIESLKLQRDFHMKQTAIVLIKQEQYENYKKALENRRRGSSSSSDFEDTHDNESTTIQVAIYKNMDLADSLLGLLIKKGSDTESLKSYQTADSYDNKSEPGDIDIIGTKHPKDEGMVIEELRILNDQLHTLVYKLVNQLDASKQEVFSLKERIKNLENSKNEAHSKNSSNNLKVITDSSGGTSPFVFSPCSEFSPEVPPLAPLEMPNFDFANIAKNAAHDK